MASAALQIARLGASASERLGRRVELAIDPLMLAAERRTGLTSWVDTDFREALENLLRSCRNDGHLNALGRLLVHTYCVDKLSNRLRIGAALRDQPEILRRPLPRPIFVLGWPRTGTTLLHRLLASDPNHRALAPWETLYAPTPGMPPEMDRRQRIRAAKRFIRLFYLLAPRMRRIHYVEAERPYECYGLLQNTFLSVNQIQFNAWSYLEWFRRQDMRAAYRYYAQQLRLLSSGDAAPRPLVLKYPFHLWHIDCLLEQFPDARFVWTHRDPAASVASDCSLGETAIEVVTDRIDRTRLGEFLVGYFRDGLSAGMRARTQHPERFFDVRYADLVRDPRQTVKAIYEHFGMETSSGLWSAVDDHLRVHRKDRFGKHDYDLSRFGLTQERVRDAFGSYCSDYELLPAT